MALAKCQLPDSQYLTTLKTTVVACRPFVEPVVADAKGKDKKPAAKPKADEKDKAKAKPAADAKTPADTKATGPDGASAAAAPAAAEPQFEVVLADTVLFPVGGGQPCDYGAIGDAKVSAVYRNPESAAAGAAAGAADPFVGGAVVHRTNKALVAGASVDVSVDWSRRFDHMQQHTGQHLISAVAVNTFGWKTASWCLTDAPRDCYIEFDTPDITDEQWTAFEAAVNAAIRASLRTKVHVFASLAEAKTSELVLRSKGIPADLKGPVRLIEIDGTDFNTCCGTHLKATSEIQVVLFTRKEKARKHTIVYFLAGNRAIDAAARMNAVQRRLATLLSVGPDAHVAAVTQLQTSLKAVSKSRDKLLKELAAAQAPALLAAAAAANRKVVCVHRDGDDAGPAYSAALIEAVGALGDAKTSPTGAAVGNAKDVHLFVTDAESGSYVLTGAASAKHGPEISKLLNGRGGGKGKYQGKAPAPITEEQHKKVADYLYAQADLKA